MEMSTKSEFKNFIKMLTTEICKEVLLEDLKKANESISETTSIYQSLNNEYSDIADELNKQVNNFQSSSSKLGDYMSTINTNNERIHNAVMLVEGKHEKVINKIISNNNEALKEYKANVQKLTREERERFINELSSTIHNESQKLISQLSTILSAANIKGISEKVSLISDKTIKLIDSMILTQNKIDSSQKTIKQSIDKLESSVKNHVEVNTGKVSSNIKSLDLRLSATNASIDKIMQQMDIQQRKIRNLTWLLWVFALIIVIMRFI